MTSWRPTTWPSSSSHPSAFGCVLMSPRPSELELGSVSWNLVGQSNRRAFLVQGNTAKLGILDARLGLNEVERIDIPWKRLARRQKTGELFLGGIARIVHTR